MPKLINYLAMHTFPCHKNIRYVLIFQWFTKFIFDRIISMPHPFLRPAISLVMLCICAMPTYADAFDDAVAEIEKYGRVEHSDGNVYKVTISEPLNDEQLGLLSDAFAVIAPVTGVRLAHGENITDLTPLRNLRPEELELFDIYNVEDLSALAGLTFQELVLYIGRQEPARYHAKIGPTDLTPLADTIISELRLINLDGVTDLSMLSGIPLTYIELRGMDGIVDISPLAGIALESLSLKEASKLEDISSLRDMPLRSLLIRATGISDISAIADMPLRSLTIIDSPRITEIPVLSNTKITRLILSGLPEITSLTPIGPQSGLGFLELENLPKIANLDIFDLPSLRTVALSDLTGLENINGLTNANLSAFFLENSDLVSDISPLEGQPLERVSFRRSDGITDITALIGAPLTELNIINASKIMDLSPLAGMSVNILTDDLKLRQTMGPD